MVTAVLLPLVEEEAAADTAAVVEEAAVADTAAVVAEEAVSAAVVEAEEDMEVVVANLAPKYPRRAANRSLSK